MLCSQKSFAVFGFIFSYFPLVNVFYSLIYAYLFCFFSAKLFFAFLPKQHLSALDSFHSSLYIVRKCLFGFDKILVFYLPGLFQLFNVQKKAMSFSEFKKLANSER